MTRTLLIGSGNRDKAAELRGLLADSHWEVRSLDEYPETPEPVEDADTFEGNALLKARYYSEMFELPCVADDSGIAVEALDGAPGVFSARYAGEGCTYADNNEKLLNALAAVPDEKRRARFVCCAAFVGRDGTEFCEFGTVEGYVARECRGGNGFGYDPVFVPDGFELTFGQMEPKLKNSLSHRGEAFRKLSDRLKTLN